jgi:outer membrane protein assembly factor BamB
MTDGVQKNSSALFVQYQTDLTPTAISFSPFDGALTGDNVTVNATIAEIGNNASGAFTVGLYVDDVLVNSTTVPSLAASSSTFATILWTATSELHDIKIMADSGGAVTESDETNNNLTAPYAVDWPALNRNQRRTSTAVSGPTNNTTLWVSNKLGATDYSQEGGRAGVAIADGKIFFGTKSHYSASKRLVAALDLSTGATLWKTVVSGDIDYSTPAVYKGRVYIGTRDGNLYCLNASTGAIIWNYTVSDPGSTVLLAGIEASPIVYNNTVFFGNVGNATAASFYALNATDGSLIAKVTYGPSPAYQIQSSPAILGYDKVCFGTNITGGGSPNGNVVCLYTSSLSSAGSYGGLLGPVTRGAPAIFYNTTVGYSFPDLVSGDAMYVATQINTSGTAAHLSALKASTLGSSYWVQNFTAVDAAGTPTAGDGRVYVTTSGVLQSFYQTNGTWSWNYSGGGTHEYGSPVYANGTVYIVDGLDQTDPIAHWIRAVNSSTGKNIWNYSMPAYSCGPFAGSSPAVLNGKLYFAYGDSRVYALGTNNAPTQSQPVLNSTLGTNLSTEDLTCWNQSTSDVEGSPLFNTFAWYKNGSPFASLLLSFNTREGGIGTTVEDYSGNGKDGTLAGGANRPEWTMDGASGGAYEFDGAASYISLPATLEDGMTNFTFEAWVYPVGTNINTWHRVFDFGDGTSTATTGKYMYLTTNSSSGSVTFNITTAGSNNGQSISSTAGIPINAWTHLAVTLNGNTGRLYINGQLNKTSAITIDPKDLSAVNNYIGVSSTSANFFNGTLDEVYIYPNALSDEQIALHYALQYNVLGDNETTGTETWRCAVTPTDRILDGVTMNSNNLTVIGIAANFENVRVDDDIPFPYNQIDLAAGQTKNVKCNATVNDIEGGLDFNTTVPTGRFYTSPGTNTCTGNNSDCYVNSSCAWLGVKNSTAQYVECTFPVWFNARNTTGLGWKCNLTETDLGAKQAFGTNTTDINALLAVGAPTTIPFGAMSVGDTSAADVNASIQNYGNVQIDLALNGSTLTCNSGTIATSYLHYNCTHYGQTYSTNMAYLPSTVPGATSNCTGFNLAMNSTATTQTPIAPVKNLPWKVNIPGAVGGACSGYVWFVAVAG